MTTPRILASCGDRYVIQTGEENGLRLGRLVDLQQQIAGPVQLVGSIGNHTFDDWAEYEGPLTAADVLAAVGIDS